MPNFEPIEDYLDTKKWCTWPFLDGRYNQEIKRKVLPQKRVCSSLPGVPSAGNSLWKTHSLHSGVRPHPAERCSQVQSLALLACGKRSMLRGRKACCALALLLWHPRHLLKDLSLSKDYQWGLLKLTRATNILVIEFEDTQITSVLFVGCRSDSIYTNQYEHLQIVQRDVKLGLQKVNWIKGDCLQIKSQILWFSEVLKTQVANTRPVGWIRPSTLFYPAWQLVPTCQQHRALT